MEPRRLSRYTTFKVGRLTCHALEGGRQHLDGGAMFGIIPKALWARRAPPDDRNRIPLALRCLLIEHDDGLVLIDTGIGNKENSKFIDIYGVDNVGQEGRTKLEDALRELGHGPDDIRWVINTHLHFDHAGGDTWLDPSGKIGLAFPNARYVVQREELDFARHTNERTAGSYLAPNFQGVPFQLIEARSKSCPAFAVSRHRDMYRITSRFSSRAAARRPALSPISCRRRRICRCPGSWATTSSRS